jgi:hypothetical protein
VCPLLVETKDGLRCSANTPEVRPFWGRTATWYGGTAFAFYLVAALGVFIFLRSVGFPVSVLDVGIPTRWERLDRARAWYFFEQSKRSFANGHSAEGLLYLANAYEFDPSNYQIGITLAKSYQVAQPAQSDRVFAQLMHDHPDRSATTAWDWYRALLQRANFPRIIPLALEQTVADPGHAHAWMRALLFATSQIGDDTALRDLRANPAPAAKVWYPLLDTELLVRAHKPREARARIDHPWPADAPPFTLYYRISTLIALNDPLAALDLNDRARQALGDEAYFTLRLDALATAGAKNDLRGNFELLLGQRTNLAVIKILCGQLIRHPDRDLFARLADKIDRDQLALDSETAGIWFSLLCTAGVVGDETRLHAIVTRLKAASPNPFVALILVEGFFTGKIVERRIASILPILPIPIEISYALIERYPSPPPSGPMNSQPSSVALPRGTPKK